MDVIPINLIDISKKSLMAIEQKINNTLSALTTKNKDVFIWISGFLGFVKKLNFLNAT